MSWKVFKRELTKRKYIRKDSDNDNDEGGNIGDNGHSIHENNDYGHDNSNYSIIVNNDNDASSYN